MSKPQTINLRLSEKEKEIARQLAENEGLSISAYVRRLILLTARKAKQAA